MAPGLIYWNRVSGQLTTRVIREGLKDKEVRVFSKALDPDAKAAPTSVTNCLSLCASSFVVRTPGDWRFKVLVAPHLSLTPPPTCS